MTRIRASVKCVHLIQDMKEFRSDKVDGEKRTHCFIPRLHVWAEETMLSSVASSPLPKLKPL